MAFLTLHGPGVPVDILIREMGDDDLDAVVKLEHESHLHPWSLELFRRELDNPLARIDLIYAGPVLAGYLCSWLVADELEIQNVAISPRFRRQGLARRLIDHVLLRACKAGAERILLEVRAGNVPARELYRQCGFEECGLRRGYYPDGEDAVLMVSTPARLS